MVTVFQARVHLNTLGDKTRAVVDGRARFTFCRLFAFGGGFPGVHCLHGVFDGSLLDYHEVLAGVFLEHGILGYEQRAFVGLHDELDAGK